MGSTKVELVEDLRAKGMGDGHPIIRAALAGHFHDYDSPHMTPKVALVKALKRAGPRYWSIRDKVMNGAYDDESPTPEQQAEYDATLAEIEAEDPGFTERAKEALKEMGRWRS